MLPPSSDDAWLLLAVVLWAPQAEARGAVLAAPDELASRVSVDPAVLEQLLDLALDHALVTGDAISLRLRSQPSSRQTLLLIDVQRSGAITPATSRAMPVGSEQDGGDDLRWLMLSQLARASGIASRRERSGSMLSLVLTFPAPYVNAPDSGTTVVYSRWSSCERTGPGARQSVGGGERCAFVAKTDS